MSPGSAVHVVMYDQQVFAQSKARAGQHQNCKHHFWHSTVQSLHICQPQNKTKTNKKLASILALKACGIQNPLGSKYLVIKMMHRLIL